MKKIMFLLIIITTVGHFVTAQEERSSLVGKVICLDSGHGGTAVTDSYRVGPTGEREEWVNLRVALLLEEMLEKKGAKVIMTRTTDEDIPLSKRAEIAKENKADVFLSIHHNATADINVNFPIIYFHGNASENKGGVALGREIAFALIEYLYKKPIHVSLVSDHTIFPQSGAVVLRETYGIPSILAEASFFTNPDEEGRLKKYEHNRNEASGYLMALESFFKKTTPSIEEKYSIVKLSPFKVFQEAERMNDDAKLWYEDYVKANELMTKSQSQSIIEAYNLFTRSARSFPDSYVAKECHENRAVLLKRMGKFKEASEAKTRSKEFFVEVENTP